MNIIRYLSDKIKSKLKKFKLYTATVILTVTTATAGVLTACTSKTNNNNSAKNTTEVVTEVPEEKEEENVVDDLTKLGVVFTQECGTEYYRIDKSSVGEHSSIIDYFENKVNIPIYDVKCSGPNELEDYIKESGDSSFDELLEMSYLSAISYNKNISEQYLSTMQTILNDNYNPNRGWFSHIALKYNLLNLKVKEVNEDGSHLSRFDSKECCIYLNMKNITSGDTLRLAFEYAIEQASVTAEVVVGGKRAYCSLKNFYYNIDTNTIIETGKTYSDSRIVWMYNEYQNFSNTNPERYKDIATYYIASDLLEVGLGNEQGTNVVDFSEKLNNSIKDRNIPSEDAAIIARILINSDSNKEGYCKEAVEHFMNSGKSSRNAKYIIDQAVPYGNPETIALQEELVEYANSINPQSIVNDEHSQQMSR